MKLIPNRFQHDTPAREEFLKLWLEFDELPPEESSRQRMIELATRMAELQHGAPARR